MRRFRLFLSMVVVVVLGIVVIGARPAAVAQEATPASEEMEGLTFAPIGFAQGVPLPSLADLTAARAGFEPGAGFSFAASDPEEAFVVVESGALAVRVDEMAWTITRGAGSSGEVAPGEEATLEAGDSAYVPGGVNGGSATPGRSGQKPSSSSSGWPVRGLRQRRSPSP